MSDSIARTSDERLFLDELRALPEDARAELIEEVGLEVCPTCDGTGADLVPVSRYGVTDLEDYGCRNCECRGYLGDLDAPAEVA